MKKTHHFLVIGLILIVLIAVLANSMGNSKELQGSFLDWLFGAEAPASEPEPKEPKETPVNIPTKDEWIPGTTY